jgi:hypothetical protein
MATQLTADDARQTLNAHVATKGAEIFAKYGPQIGWTEMKRILEDRTCVRYPCEIVFDASRLRPGEFAWPEPKGDQPEAGFTLFVHPHYETQPAMVPFLVLYQLVAVNYGEFASAEDAETFAAAALGLERDLYYDALCRLADQLPLTDDPAHGGHAGSCSCRHG